MTRILATFAHHAYFGSAEYLGCDSEILGYRGQGPARLIGARCHRPRPFRDEDPPQSTFAGSRRDSAAGRRGVRGGMPHKKFDRMLYRGGQDVLRFA